VRPDAAAALAFRMRRLRGVADVDLLTGAYRPPVPPARLSRATLVFLVPTGVAAVLALVAALALLRARLRPELVVLRALGVTRAAARRPALVLATAAGAAGGVAGVA